MDTVLYAEQLAREMESRFESADFKNRVSLFAATRNRITGRAQQRGTETWLPRRLPEPTFLPY